MNKIKITLYTGLLVIALLLVSFASADPNIDPETIAGRFTLLKLNDQFVSYKQPAYYRFPKNIWFFDPIGLTYFPVERVTSTDWSYAKGTLYFQSQAEKSFSDWGMTSRKSDGKTYQQMLYLDEPYEKDVIHGTDMPNLQYLSDFYLYADLFITDSYPENSGSCFLYFSNSVVMGYFKSYGVLIDPKKGIFEASNNYDAFANIANDIPSYEGLYIIGTEEHTLDLVTPFNEEIYRDSRGSVGNAVYPALTLDARFESDYQYLTAEAEKIGANSPQPYRIEIVRVDKKTDVYINGIYVTTLNESKLDYDWNHWELMRIQREQGDIVSWTYGPILYAGGLNTTCAIGNMVIYGTK